MGPKKNHNFLPSCMDSNISGYRLIFGSQYIGVFLNNKYNEMFNIVAARCLNRNIDPYCSLATAILKPWLYENKH